MLRLICLLSKSFAAVISGVLSTAAVVARMSSILLFSPSCQEVELVIVS